MKRVVDFHVSKRKGGIPWWLRGKESTCSVQDTGSIPESGRSLGGGNGYSLQYSCLENPMDRGAWQTKVHGVARSHTQLSNYYFTSFRYLIRILYRLSHLISIRLDQIRSVAQSCPTLCDPMNHSTPGLPVPHQHPEFTETHVH